MNDTVVLLMIHLVSGAKVSVLKGVLFCFDSEGMC